MVFEEIKVGKVCEAGNTIVLNDSYGNKNPPGERRITCAF